MREIKFRQRIKGNNGEKDYWHYWGYVDGVGNYGVVSSPIYTSKGKSYQYTGMKTGENKDGQEIYEGNIVVKHIRNQLRLERFVVMWSEQQCGFNISRGYNHWYEVVGSKIGNKKDIED